MGLVRPLLVRLSVDHGRLGVGWQPDKLLHRPDLFSAPRRESLSDSKPMRVSPRTTQCTRVREKTPVSQATGAQLFVSAVSRL